MVSWDDWQSAGVDKVCLLSTTWEAGEAEPARSQYPSGLTASHKTAIRLFLLQRATSDGSARDPDPAAGLGWDPAWSRDGMPYPPLPGSRDGPAVGPVEIPQIAGEGGGRGARGRDP